jgi:hypothetical protein
MTDPTTYPRRVLLAVTGLSPQIVTETLYAIAVRGRPKHLFSRHAAVHQPDAARLAVLSFDLLEKWPQRRLVRGVAGQFRVHKERARTGIHERFRATKLRLTTHAYCSRSHGPKGCSVSL